MVNGRGGAGLKAQGARLKARHLRNRRLATRICPAHRGDGIMQGMSGYLDQMAQSFAAPAYPNAVLFRGDTVKSKGAVVGVRDGFIVFAGPATVGQNKGVFIGIRTRKINQPESALKAVKELAGVKSFVGRKTVTLKEDAILVFCPYVLKKPAPAELCDLLQQMLMCLQPYAAGFDGKCEDCGTATVREIVLRNGTPGITALPVSNASRPGKWSGPKNMPSVPASRSWARWRGFAPRSRRQWCGACWFTGSMAIR